MKSTILRLSLRYILSLQSIIRCCATAFSSESAPYQQKPRVTRSGDEIAISQEATDEDLAVLQGMQGVKVVRVENGPGAHRAHITDAGLANLEGLTELEVLQLSEVN